MMGERKKKSANPLLEGVKMEGFEIWILKSTSGRV